MKTRITKHFPASTIGIVSQTGAAQSDREQGVTVELHLDNGSPTMAEAYSPSQEHYAAIGLEMNGKDLVGYDGVFEIPGEVLDVLRENGFSINL